MSNYNFLLKRLISDDLHPLNYLGYPQDSDLFTPFASPKPSSKILHPITRKTPNKSQYLNKFKLSFFFFHPIGTGPP